MVPAQQDEKSATRGRHMEQSRIRKDIIPQLASPIFPPHRVDIGLRTSVQDAQIQVAAGIVDGPVEMIGIKDAVDDQICKGEEHG